VNSGYFHDLGKKYLALLYTCSMQIRPILDSDLPAVLEAYRQCEDFLALGPNPTASMEMIAGDRALSRSEGGEYCGLFANDGKIIGIFDFVRSGYQGDLGCAYIELLMIAAPYRGRGLGEEAVRWLEKELIGSGTNLLRAGVQVNNPGAIRFWQRMGFTIVSEAEAQADGTICYQLEKHL
jgi:ribosomal protein S18 acetylase RimI-like enzyme